MILVTISESMTKGTKSIMSILLDIGGGATPLEGAVNLDPKHGTPPFDVRVQDGIPLDDDTVAHVNASHVLEHIPAGAERIRALNEIHRVLVPGGTLRIEVPVVGHRRTLVNAPEAWADPTHVSYWWFPDSLSYFCSGGRRADADYGIRYWEPLTDEDWHVNDWLGVATLRKPVPPEV